MSIDDALLAKTQGEIMSVLSRTGKRIGWVRKGKKRIQVSHVGTEIYKRVAAQH